MVIWFRNLKTALKLMLVFAIMAVIVGTVGFIGISMVKRLDGFIHHMYDEGLVMAIDMGIISEESNNIRIGALKITTGLYNDRIQEIFDGGKQSSQIALVFSDKIISSSLRLVGIVKYLLDSVIVKTSSYLQCPNPDIV